MESYNEFRDRFIDSMSDAEAAELNSMADQDLQVFNNDLKKRYEEVNQENAQKESGIAQKGLDFILKVGETIDKYSGAPARRFEAELEKGKGIGEAVSKAGQVITGQVPAKTGSEISAELGASTKTPEGTREATPSSVADEFFRMLAASKEKPANVKEQIKEIASKDPVGFSEAAKSGLIRDVVLDPTWLLPTKAITAPIGVAAKVTGTVGKGVGKALSVAGRTVESTVLRSAPITTAIEEGGKIASDVVKSVAETAKNLIGVNKPKEAKDFGKYASIAQNAGINPDELPLAVRYGTDSFLSRAERSHMAGTMGEKAKTMINEQKKVLENGIDSEIQAITGTADKIDAATAGEALREGYNKKLSEVFGDDYQTYQSVIKNNKGLEQAPISRELLDKRMGKIYKDAERYARVTPGEAGQGAQDVLKTIQQFQENVYSLQDAIDFLQGLGKNLEIPSGARKAPFDIEKNRQLYRDIRELVYDSIEQQVGPEIAKTLKATNEKVYDFIEKSKPIRKIITNEDLANEKVFNSVLSDTNRIKAIKNTVDPETFGKVLGAKLDRDLIARNVNGISFGQTLKNIRSLKNQPINKELFGENLLKKIEDYSDLGNRMGADKLSFSETGADIAFRDIVKAAPTEAMNKRIIDRVREQVEKRGKKLPKEFNNPDLYMGKNFNSTYRRLSERGLLPNSEQIKGSILRDISIIKKETEEKK